MSDSEPTRTMMADTTGTPSPTTESTTHAHPAAERRSAAAKKAAATRARNRAATARETAAHNAERKAAAAPDGRSPAARVQDYAQRAVLVQVGATLIARDAIASTVEGLRAKYASPEKAQREL